MVISFTLNNQPVTVEANPATPLLDVLREDLGLTGTKQGCDHEGECGVCTVLLDDTPVRSCLTPVGKVQGRSVITIEGLGDPAHLHPLQEAFIEAGAVQCGFCTPGMLLAAKALLDATLDPTRAQIIEALEGNLCRCTGYTRIVAAVELAAARLRGEGAVMPPSPEVPVGGSSRRVDSVDKVTGRTKYVEDIVMDGMLHAVVLRSPHHHARLVSLDTEAASRVEGVVRILTAADVPGELTIPEFSKGEPVLTPVGETVKMVGAPVAFVAATSQRAAQAGADAIEAVYEPLPHTFSALEALDGEGFSIYREGNELSGFEIAHGDLEAEFARSDVIVETRYRTPFQEHAPLERDAALGYIDDEGRITVVSGTHEPHWMRTYIAEVLALPEEQVRVIMPPMGGSFGKRQDAWPFLAMGVIVYHTRRPVLMISTRRESFDASTKRHPYDMRFKIGATSDGELTGIQVDITANTGGYDALGFYIPNYAVTGSGGPYHWRAVHAVARSVYTNGPRSGAFRGFGATQSVFGIESGLDELVERLGADPLNFRLANALPQSATSFMGYPVAESLGFVEVLEAIRPHYERMQERVTAFNARSDGALRKGLGFAGTWHRFGKSGALLVQAEVELRLDGGFLLLFSAPDYGQGTTTAMGQVAAEVLGVSRGRIQAVNADTGRTPASGISGASRSIYWVGSAVGDACQRLRWGIQATAAELLDCAPQSLTFTDEAVMCANGQVGLDEIAQEYERLGNSRRATGAFDLSSLFPDETRPEYVPFFVTGAQAAEVVVNMKTGETQVERLAAAHDVGRAINPVDARGQIEGAVLMGIGTALMEEYVPDRSTGLSDYYIPTIRSAPEIAIELVEVPSVHGAFGSKGLGEPALFPTAPAIINAISRAIGARVREIPATPERVLEEINRKDHKRRQA